MTVGISSGAFATNVKEQTIVVVIMLAFILLYMIRSSPKIKFLFPQAL